MQTEIENIKNYIGKISIEISSDNRIETKKLYVLKMIDEYKKIKNLSLDNKEKDKTIELMSRIVTIRYFLKTNRWSFIERMFEPMIKHYL